MVDRQDAIKAIRARLERDSTIDIHHNRIDIRFEGKTLAVAGEVDSVAAKRLALRRIRELEPGLDVADRLRVAPSERREDGAIRDALVSAFAQESAFHNCTVEVWNKGHLEPVTDARSHSDCHLEAAVEEGVVTLTGEVISLSHRRLATLLAWWVTGTRDVVNALAVVPAEEDSDDELTDAIQLALEKDPMLRDEQIRARTVDGAVTLEGMARGEMARRIAEDDVWCLGDVTAVDNRIQIGG